MTASCSKVEKFVTYALSNKLVLCWYVSDLITDLIPYIGLISDLGIASILNHTINSDLEAIQKFDIKSDIKFDTSINLHG